MPIPTPSITLGDCKTCPTRGDANNAPKLFGCDTVAACQSYRPSYTGETGQRNILRAPGFIGLDTQHLAGADANNSDLAVDPDAALNSIQPPADWSNFTKIQGTPRVMQVGLRFSF